MGRSLLPIVLIAVGTLAACGPETVAPSATAQPSPSPMATATAEPTANPTPTASPVAIIKPAFHVPRVLYVVEYQLLGWSVTDAFLLNDGTPAVIARWPGAPNDEGVVIVGAEDDVIGLKMVSTDGAKMADFLFKWSSAEVTQWVIDQLGNVADTGVDQTVSKVFGHVTVDFESTGGSLVQVTLRPTS
jgi:hypothetical protein